MADPGSAPLKADTSGKEWLDPGSAPLKADTSGKEWRDSWVCPSQDRHIRIGPTKKLKERMNNDNTNSQGKGNTPMKE